MLDSVRTRLTLWHAAILSLLLLSFSAAVYAIFLRNFMDRADSVLRSASDATRSILARELSESGIDELAARDTVRSLKIPNHTIAIFDEHGEVLAESPPGVHEKFPLPPPGSLSVQDARIYTSDDPGDPGEQRRVVVSRVILPPADRTYFIVITRSLTPLLGELAADRFILLAAVPAIVLIAAAAAWFLTRRSLAPVLAMSRQAQRIGTQNTDERLPVANARDELGLLAATFNGLLSRLAAALEGQRRFMADASHELRTPISVVRTTAAVNLARTGRTEEEYRGALEIIESQSRRLSRMVEDMLNLARADSGSFTVRMRPFHLDEVLLETAQAAAVLAKEKEIRVEIGDLTEAPFSGDEDLLRQMVLNLLDNAVKYTPARGRIRVALERLNESWLIRVEDNGQGIPEEARPHIFDRFYRVEAQSKSVGAGLGLAIAQWIARLHGGMLELEHSGPDGSTFLATLPVNGS